MDEVKNSKIKFSGLENKLTFKARESQINKANSINYNSQAELMNSMQLIRQAKNPKATSLTQNSKLNEQDLFASLMHQGLKQIDPKLGDKFSRELPLLIEKLSEVDPENSVLKASKRMLYKLVKLRMLSNGAAKILRRIVVGKAQLDDNLALISTKRIEGAKETPLRAVKTVLERVPENKRASEALFSEYKENNKVLKGN